MKSIRLLVFAAWAALCFAGSANANISQFVGNWKNVNNNARGVARVAIQLSGNTVRLRVWAGCSPNPCDWGWKNVVTYGTSVQSSLPQQAIVLRADYDQGFAQRQVIVRPAGGNRLRVEVLTHFTSGGRSNNVDTGLFRQASPTDTASLSEDCVTFNPATTHAARVQGRSKLVDGSHWILDFGNNQGEARRSEQIVKHYRFSQQCFIKRPNPSMTYWLASQHGASGAMPGEDCVGFNRNNIAARFSGGKWKVMDGRHAMFAFPNKAQAEQAVKVIKHYGFTRSCFVGRPGPSMAYLRR